MRTLITLSIGLAVVVGAARAEQSVAVGPYEIHYSAVGTEMLDRQVARSYGITRSRSRAMLSITVLENGRAIAASIDASAVNREGQQRSLRMRVVEEQDTVYHLGFVNVSNAEILDFDVKVTPAGADTPIIIRFAQTFFVD